MINYLGVGRRTYETVSEQKTKAAQNVPPAVTREAVKYNAIKAEQNRTPPKTSLLLLPDTYFSARGYSLKMDQSDIGRLPMNGSKLHSLRNSAC